MKLKETTALQAISVIAWLWAKPAADALDSYGFWSSTASLIKVVVLFVAGVVISSYFPSKYGKKVAIPVLIASIFLLISYVFFYDLYLHNIWRSRFLVGLLTILGMPLLGFSLGALKISWRPKSFVVAVCVLILFYVAYWGEFSLCRYIPIEAKSLWNLYSLMTYVIQIAIAIQFWRTMSMECVRQSIERIPKLTKFVAGLFWGMFLVFPADRYSPAYEAIIMLLLSPLFAYIFTVLLRAIYTLMQNLVRLARSERPDWKNIICWW